MHGTTGTGTSETGTTTRRSVIGRRGPLLARFLPVTAVAVVALAAVEPSLAAAGPALHSASAISPIPIEPALAAVETRSRVVGAARPGSAASTSSRPLGEGSSRRLDLWRPRAFASQATMKLCVGASVQMMRNLALSEDDTSGVNQAAYLALAQARSRDVTDGGADPWGWAAALRAVGAGRYAVVAAPDLDSALAAAARAMWATGRPAGLLVHHGRHAVLLTGYELASAAPGARVAAAALVDPLYPRPGRLHLVVRPGTFLPRAILDPEVGEYEAQPGADSSLVGRYIVVVPTAEDAS